MDEWLRWKRQPDDCDISLDIAQSAARLLIVI
jgi:hypothetical protein